MQRAGDRLNTDAYNEALRRTFMNKDFSVSSRMMLSTTGTGESDDNITLHIQGTRFLQIQVVHTGQQYHDNGSGFEVPLEWDDIRENDNNSVTYTSVVTYHTILRDGLEYKITATEFNLDSWTQIIFLDGSSIDIQYAKSVNLHYVTRYNRGFSFSPAIKGLPTPDIITPANLVINNANVIPRSILFTTQYLNSASSHTEKVYAFGEPEHFVFAARKNRTIRVVWTPPSTGGYLLINGVEVNGTSPTLTPYASYGQNSFYEGYIYGEGIHEFNFKRPNGNKRNIRRLVVLQHAKDDNLTMQRPLNFPITNKIINDFIKISNRKYYTRPVSLNRFIASNDLQVGNRDIITANFIVGLFNTCGFFQEVNNSWECWE